MEESRFPLFVPRDEKASIMMKQEVIKKFPEADVVKIGDPTVEAQTDICDEHKKTVVKVFKVEGPTEWVLREDNKNLSFKSCGESPKDICTDFENVPSNLVKSDPDNFHMTSRSKDVKIEADQQPEVMGETGPDLIASKTNNNISLQGKSRVLLTLNDEQAIAVDSFCLTSAFTEKDLKVDESGVNIDKNSQIHYLSGTFYSHEQRPSPAASSVSSTTDTTSMPQNKQREFQVFSADTSTPQERESEFQAFRDDMTFTPKDRGSGLKAISDDTTSTSQERESGFQAFGGDTKPVVESVSLVSCFKPEDTQLSGSTINKDRRLSEACYYHKQSEPSALGLPDLDPSTATRNTCISQVSDGENFSNYLQDRNHSNGREVSHCSGNSNCVNREVGGKQLHSPSDLCDHLEVHTAGKAYSCHICAERCPQVSGVSCQERANTAPKKHKLIHLDSKPYKCDVCSKQFSHSSNLKKHKLIHLDSKPYKCDVCSKQFSRSYDLKVHDRIHSGSKPYKCDVCSKHFSHSSTLKTHQTVHSGSKPFKCDVCSKQFSTSSHLKKHKLIHSGSKPYKCDVCSKQFSHSSNLKKHKLIHLDSKPYKCDVCSKQFSRSYDLKVHDRIHSGSKPYKCDVCSKQFSRSSSVKMHQTVHTGIKPYMCDVCSKQFSGLSNLKSHESIHSGSKPYMCDVCSKQFSRLSNLKVHGRIHLSSK